MAPRAPGDRPLLEGLALRLVPRTARFGPRDWAEFFRIHDAALAERPFLVRQALRLFLFFLRWSPVPRYGSRWDRLSTRDQDAVLAGLQDSRSRALRTGFWGLKTLVCMGCYGRAEAAEGLSYRPTLDGNRRLRD